MEASKTATIRFGVFELDPASGELRKHGTRVRLQEQPFQVLLALLERHGEVVSREELQQRLWPDGTFVDYEDGLATAVRKVRAALGDSATKPLFIETLPKRGYRFLAPVEGSGEPADGEPAVPSPRPRPHRRRYVALAASMGALALLLFGAFLTEKEAAGPPLLKFVLAPGEDVHDPVISPDGRYVAFVTKKDEGALWIREMSADGPRRGPRQRRRRLAPVVARQRLGRLPIGTSFIPRGHPTRCPADGHRRLGRVAFGLLVARRRVVLLHCEP